MTLPAKGTAALTLVVAGWVLAEHQTQLLPVRKSLERMLPFGQLWPADWEAWRLKGSQKNIYEKNLGPVPNDLDTLIAPSTSAASTRPRSRRCGGRSTGT